MELFEKTNQDQKLKTISEANKKFANNLVIELFYGKLLYNEEKYSKAINVLKDIKFQKSITREGPRCLILAKSYEKIGNYEKSFKYFKITNDINKNFINKNTNKNNTLQTIKDRVNFLKNQLYKLDLNKYKFQ